MNAAKSNRRRAVSGVLLLFMLVLSIGDILSDAIPSIYSGALAWLAALFLWPDTTHTQRTQIGILGLIGLAGLAWGWFNGVDIDPFRVLSQNQLIISMMAAVTLLRLLNPPLDTSKNELPTGKGAYLKSMLGVHLFGAVINVSALVIMADRLSRDRPLSEPQALLLSRTFTLAVFYSPFIGGMALALAYTPGSQLPLIMLFGIPLAIAGLLIILSMASWDRNQDLKEFKGYPVHLESLWLPALLAGAVLGLHTLFPELSVLALVIILSPIIVVLTLVFRTGLKATTGEVAEFIKRRLSDMSGELMLFLSAGVLASGVAAMFSTWGDWVPFHVFDAGTASLILVGTVTVAIFGVHPVVIVSTAVPLLAPLHPDPSLLALLFVMCWGIGCAISPLSGTNVTLNGRYGISSWIISRRNIKYCTAMSIVAIGLLHLYELILN